MQENGDMARTKSVKGALAANPGKMILGIERLSGKKRRTVYKYMIPEIINFI